jgi:hypothetical protein
MSRHDGWEVARFGVVSIQIGGDRPIRSALGMYLVDQI